jgi:hypothetical protein
MIANCKAFYPGSLDNNVSNSLSIAGYNFLRGRRLGFYGAA